MIAYGNSSEVKIEWPEDLQYTAYSEKMSIYRAVMHYTTSLLPSNATALADYEGLTCNKFRYCEDG